MSMFETESSRWAAVQSRDRSADGKFVYCVKTTGIYCRPVCKARLARRSNVTFHNNSTAAEADGFRPCMRCKPELKHHDPQSDVISKACSTMRASADQGKESSLGDLAAEAGLTRWHFHRVFKSVTGVTPKSHAAALLGKSRTTVEVPSSRPGSLTPSYGQSSGASTGPQTPNMTPTPLVMGEWQESEFLEDFEPTSVTKMNPEYLQPQIEFTIQPWRTGYVVIAASDNEVRGIDVGDNYVDLVAMVQRRFPTAPLLLSDWQRSNSHDTSNKPTQVLFASVMEALENPTGKILHLPTNVFEVYG
jgi:AraC family transcriptional regulator, regulatory protein of adaptative response / methylated-DNA-[protein]-cysteine methyltransferase